MDDQPPGDDRKAGPEIGQRELREQRNRAPAGFAQIAPNTDRSVVGRVDDRADIEAVRSEWIWGWALRAVSRARRRQIIQLIEVLLHRTSEWV